MKANIKYITPDIEFTRFGVCASVMYNLDNSNLNGDEVFRGGSDEDVTTAEDVFDW